MDQQSFNGNNSTHIATYRQSLPALIPTQNIETSTNNYELGEESDPIVHFPSIFPDSKIGGMELPRTVNSDLRIVVYDKLEQKRASKLGVKPLRKFNVTRSYRTSQNDCGSRSLPYLDIMPATLKQHRSAYQSDPIFGGLIRSNTLAPFTTLTQKATCGYFFNWDTLNKKVKIDVPPSDLVKWRANYAIYGQKQP